MGTIKRRKAVDTTTYKSKTPKAATSYDVSQPETDTPQEVRESREAEGEQKRAKEAKDGKGSVN